MKKILFLVFLLPLSLVLVGCNPPSSSEENAATSVEVNVTAELEALSLDLTEIIDENPADFPAKEFETSLKLITDKYVDSGEVIADVAANSETREDALAEISAEISALDGFETTAASEFSASLETIPTSQE